MRSLIFVIGLLAWTAAAPAPAQEAPAASDLLFETQDWRSVSSDTALLYRYERVSSLPSERVRGFSDTIRLLVGPGSTAESRNVQVEMFSGGQRRPAGPFDDVSGNPVLVLFLEQHLQTLVAAIGANPRYFRNAIRTGLRDGASVTPLTTAYRDGQVPAWRIAMRPFLQDPHHSQMMGLDTLTYSFVVSDHVPGKIVSIDVRADDTNGHPLLLETLSYDPDGP
ncbi:hypothetical protein [Microvirga sp. TS319]|uniref:hypothetical protein n=1 Tax=Microvirga sp. TS319 TaxID=3241165 RepID=UPI00351A51E6